INNFKIAIVGLIFLATTFIGFNLYLNGTLKGDINNHILAGERHGTPAALRERGISPLYRGASQSGWDGQF
ncbi:hypothetical protein, partial [Streptococcus pneumoniae]